MVFQKIIAFFSLGALIKKKGILHPGLISCSLRKFNMDLGKHIPRIPNILSLISNSKLTVLCLLTVLPLKIWKINPILKLRTAYYKSPPKDTGDIWDKILLVGRAAKLKWTKPDSNSAFNSTTTYKSPQIKDNSSILKIKVLLAAWLLFKFWFYILLNYAPWKK